MFLLMLFAVKQKIRVGTCHFSKISFSMLRQNNSNKNSSRTKKFLFLHFFLDNGKNFFYFLIKALR